MGFTDETTSLDDGSKDEEIGNTLTNVYRSLAEGYNPINQIVGSEAVTLLMFRAL